MAKQNQVQPAASGAVSTPLDFGDMAGGGGDSLKPKDLIIPQILVLQAGSPQCDRAESVYHPDAQPGMLLLSAKNEVRDSVVGLVFVPVRKTDHVEERTPKVEGDNSPTKFVNLHAPNSPVVREAEERAAKDPSQAGKKYKKLFTAEGNQLRDCVYLWGYTLADDQATAPQGIAVIKITGSKFNPFRTQFATPIENVQEETGNGDKKRGVPWWGVKIRVGSFMDKQRNGGNKFYNFTFTPVAGPGKWRESIISPVKDEAGNFAPLYQFGAEINKRIVSGEMRVDQVDAGVDADDLAADGDGPKATAGF